MKPIPVSYLLNLLVSPLQAHSVDNIAPRYKLFAAAQFRKILDFDLREKISSSTKYPAAHSNLVAAVSDCGSAPTLIRHFTPLLSLRSNFGLEPSISSFSKT